MAFILLWNSAVRVHVSQESLNFEVKLYCMQFWGFPFQSLLNLIDFSGMCTCCSHGRHLVSGESSGAEHTWLFSLPSSSWVLWPYLQQLLSWELAAPYRGTRPSFSGLCFCCLGKHSQTETGFKANCLSTKVENSITSYCVVLTFKSAKIRWLVKEILVFWSIG